jgi:hypothetical protein
MGLVAAKLVEGTQDQFLLYRFQADALSGKLQLEHVDGRLLATEKIRRVGERDFVATRKHHNSFNDVLKLADITGPPIVLKPGLRTGHQHWRADRADLFQLTLL